MKRLLLMASLLCASAQADESAPLLYTRADIAILRAAPPADAFLPWEDKLHGDKGLFLNAEVRDGATLYRQQGWFNFSAPSENGGVLLAFSAPLIAPIAPSAQYAPLDILLIDKEGRITQIMPSLLLSNLEEEIYPASPILAMLFLKGGACEKFSIHPGDYVVYKLFKKPPAVLNAPPAPAAAPATAPAAP